MKQDDVINMITWINDNMDRCKSLNAGRAAASYENDEWKFTLTLIRK